MPGHPGQAAVDDRGHPVDGQRGLGDVRRQDDLARLTGAARHHRPPLIFEGQIAVQRQHDKARLYRELLQLLLAAADLGAPRQKDQDVAFFLAQELAQGAADTLPQRLVF